MIEGMLLGRAGCKAIEEPRVGPPRVPTRPRLYVTHPLETVNAGLGLRLRSSRSGIPSGVDLEAGIGVSCVVSVPSAFAVSPESGLFPGSCWSRAREPKGVLRGIAPRRGVSMGGGETLCPGTVGGGRFVMMDRG